MMLDQHPNARKTKYAIYSPEDRSEIGRYAAEHGPINLNYWRKNSGEIPKVTSLPKKARGRPLLLANIKSANELFFCKPQYINPANISG